MKPPLLCTIDQDLSAVSLKIIAPLNSLPPLPLFDPVPVREILKATHERRIFEHWHSLRPKEIRSEKSVESRWNEMLSMDKFVPLLSKVATETGFISSFDLQDVPGSAGRLNSFQLSTVEHSQFLGKGKGKNVSSVDS